MDKLQLAGRAFLLRLIAKHGFAGAARVRRALAEEGNRCSAALAALLPRHYSASCVAVRQQQGANFDSKQSPNVLEDGRDALMRRRGEAQMKTKLLPLLAVGLLAGPVAAYAVPITVSAGDTLLWNFDLSGQTVAPPYAQGLFVTLLDMWDLDDHGEWSAFADLNAGGTALFSSSVNLLDLRQAYPEWIDGIWSVRLTMTAGSVSVDPCFRGLDSEATPVTDCVAGTLVTTPVPDPGTLVLFGLGLLGLGLTRRRVN